MFPPQCDKFGLAELKIHGALFVQSIDEPTLVQFFNDTGIASYGRGRHEDCKRQ